MGVWSARSGRHTRAAYVFVGYTLFVVSLIVFAITQILPADAAVMMLGENATPDALRRVAG